MTKPKEALIELNLKNIETSDSHVAFRYVAFCKYNFDKKKSKLNELKRYLKEKNNQILFENDENIKKTKQISGIYENPKDFENYLQSLNLPKYSFGIWVNFKLKAPYFSKDDDEFYIIQNPILKDYAFKVPMIRPSSWKGNLAKAFKEMLNETSDVNKRRKIIESYLRIFGAGSDEIKNIESYLKEKSKNFKDFKNKIIEFLLFELGLELDFDIIEKIKKASSKEMLLETLKEKVSKKLKTLKKDEVYPIEFQTHKGRLIIFPTFFDKLSLEIMNPHDRRKRAGTNPIHYEIVPKRTEGILQMIYIPFDGVLKKDEKLKKEVEQDLENLCKAIGKLADLGMGAKTKLGWGRFEIVKIEKWWPW